MNTFYRLLSKLKSDLHLLELLRGSGIFLFSKVCGMAGIYVFYMYISRIYGPESNGTLSFVLTVAILLSFVVNLGLNTYLVKVVPGLRRSENVDGLHLFLRSSLVVIGLISVGLGVIIYFSASTLGQYFGLSGLGIELKYIALLFVPLALILFLASYFKVVQQVALFSFLQNNWVQVLGFFILLLPLWNHLSVFEPLSAIVISAYLLLCFALWKVKEVSKRGSPKVFSPHMRTWLRSAFPMLIGGLAFMVFSMTDRLMLRFLSSLDQLGVYAVALRISNLSLLGLLSFNAIAEAKFSELYATHNMELLRKFVQRSTWIGIFISVPLITVLLLFPDFLLSMFGDGEDFLSGQSVIYLLCGANIVTSLCGANLALLNMTGNQKAVQYIILFTAVFNIGLNYMLIPGYGIAGAAFSTMVSTIIWNILAFYFVRIQLGFYTFGLGNSS